MPKWKIPTPFRYYTEKQPVVSTTGKTVTDALDDLLRQYPSLRPKLFKKNGQLYAFVNIYVGDTNTKDLQGLETPVTEDDEIRLVPSIAGG